MRARPVVGVACLCVSVLLACAEPPSSLQPDPSFATGILKRPVYWTAIDLPCPVGSNRESSTAQQQAATAQQQAATAQQQAATAQHQAAASAPPPPPPVASGQPLPLGTVVSSLPAGCTSTPVGGVDYFYCGGNFYRAVFQGNNLVYVTAKP